MRRYGRKENDSNCVRTNLDEAIDQSDNHNGNCNMTCELNNENTNGTCHINNTGGNTFKITF